MKEVFYVNSTEIYINFIKGDFPARSRFRITVTFDDVIFIDAPEMIVVYNKFTLEKVIPNVIQIGLPTKLLLYSEVDPLSA